MTDHRPTAAVKLRMLLRWLRVGMVAAGLGAIDTAAFAQTTPGTAGPISLGELFDGPESPGLKPGEAEKLLKAAAGAINPREACPQQANFKVIVKRGVPPFPQALARSRRDALIAALKQQNFPDSRYDFTYDSQGSANDVQVSYGRMRDRQAPNLHTTSVPPKGTKVKPGDRIAVTMVARDDANRVQSGIHRIQLVARTAGGDVRVGGQDYPLVPRPNCEGMPEARTLVLTYTVPNNPPPIVRLVAVTEDFVNLSDHDIGLFPTGDWYGTITWTHRVVRSIAEAVTTANADVSLKYDPRITGLTGTLVGNHTATSSGACTGRTMSPAGIQATLTGSYTEGRDAMTIRVSEKQTTPMQMQISCPGAPPVTSRHAGFYEFYEQALRELRPTADGGFQSSDEQERPCEAGSTCTTSISLTLHRARN